MYIKFSNIENKSDKNSLVEANASNLKELQNAIENGDTALGKEIKAEMDKIQEQIDLIDSLGNVSFIKSGKEQAEGNDKVVNEFANAVRSGFKNINKESLDENGGYIVPNDIQTKINQWKEVEYSLEKEISFEPVTTQKGSRTYQTRAEMTGFEDIEEGGELSEMDSPTFERVSYSIVDRGGWLPITNDLLNDTDANLTQVVTQWIARKSNATSNSRILGLAKSSTKTEIETIDELEKKIIVELGAEYRGSSKIITNDDGLWFFNQLKDLAGRKLLQPHPTEKGVTFLSVGDTLVYFKSVGNKLLPSDISTAGKKKIPMLTGDWKEAIKKYDRQKTSLLASNIAVAGKLNAFTQNLTLIRAIERNDFKVLDSKAFLNLAMVIDDSTVAGTSE